MKIELITITPDCEKVIEEAGRTCYKSKPGDKTIIQRWIKAGHLSILEHASVTFRASGVSRALTHQLVRHRTFSFCLSGDTLIFRYNQHRGHLTIKELYERQQKEQLCGRNKLMTLRSMSDNKTIVPNNFKQILYSGKKIVYSVKTKMGYEIKTSKDHIFFNSSGEVKLENLSPGDSIYVNGIELYKDKEWFQEKYLQGMNTSQIAELCGIAKCTARVWKRKHGIVSINEYKSREAWNKGICGELSHSFGREVKEKTKKKLSLSKNGEKNPQYKGEISNLTISGARQRFIKEKTDSCELCGISGVRLENHHINKNIYDDSENNKLTLCTKCHKIIHGKINTKKIVEDKIVSISFIGEEETYDIEMCEPFHNFVANGFIVHNSQQSQRYVKEDGFEFVVPNSIKHHPNELVLASYLAIMESIQNIYKGYIEDGVPKEDARFILPNACHTEIVFTSDFRNLRHFFGLRLDKHSQWEIRCMAGQMLDIVKPLAPNCFFDIEKRGENE
jgi:thymidylate synthase ThyX